MNETQVKSPFMEDPNAKIEAIYKSQERIYQKNVYRNFIYYITSHKAKIRRKQGKRAINKTKLTLNKYAR